MSTHGAGRFVRNLSGTLRDPRGHERDRKEPLNTGPSCPDGPARSSMSPLNFFYLTLQASMCRPFCKNSNGISGHERG